MAVQVFYMLVACKLQFYDKSVCYRIKANKPKFYGVNCKNSLKYANMQEENDSLENSYLPKPTQKYSPSSPRSLFH